MKSAHENRLSYLDAVRGLAALAVLCSHFVHAYGFPTRETLFQRAPLNVWFDGAAAVSLFFVLSGLVLSVRHFRTSQHPDLARFDYLGFLVARVLRIWLPLAVAFAASLLIWRIGRARPLTDPPPSQWFLDIWSQSPGWKDCIKQLLFRYTRRTDLLPQAWTLYYEIIFSALIPAGILIASRHSLWLVAAVVIGLMVHAEVYAVHFALGIILAKNFYHIERSFAGKPLLLAVVSILAAAFYTCRDPLSGRVGAATVDLLNGVGSALILICVIGSESARRLLSRKTFRYLGQTSYCTYLVHIIVLAAATPRIIAFLNGVGITGASAWALGLLCTCAITLAIADPAYRLVEVPSRELGKWFGAGLSSLCSRLPAIAPPAVFPEEKRGG